MPFSTVNDRRVSQSRGSWWQTSSVARTKPAVERRDDLLDAAEAAFLEHGINGATVDDIATRAGVAKGTFYLYFHSRADITRAVQQRYGDRFVHRLEAAVAGAGDDWGARVDAIVAAGLADDRDGRTLHDVLFVDRPPEPDEELGHGVDALADVFRNLIDEGVAAGAFEVDDPGLTAMLLFNTLHGVYNPIWSGSAVPDDAALVAAARTIFRRALGL